MPRKGFNTAGRKTWHWDENPSIAEYNYWQHQYEKEQDYQQHDYNEAEVLRRLNVMLNTYNRKHGGFRKARRQGSMRIAKPRRLPRSVFTIPGPKSKAAVSYELKFKDRIVNAFPTTAGFIFGTITNMQQGTGEKRRIGRSITVTHISWRYAMSLTSKASANDAVDSIRVILYQDRQCNKANAVVTDILESADFNSFNNLANRKRFSTLMDRQYTLNSPGGLPTETLATQTTDTFFKSVNIPIQYDGTSGNISTITSNNIGILLIVGDGGTEFASTIRIRYHDN